MSSPIPAFFRLVSTIALLTATLLTGGCCFFSKVRPAKASLDCDVGPGERASNSDPDRNLAAGDSSGTIKGNAVTLLAGVKIVVNGDLVIAAASNLQIDGRIEFPDDLDRPLSVTLISNGNITIGPNGFIGGGKAYHGVDCPSKDAGWHGAQIKLTAASVINVQGTLLGQEGGDGYSPSASKTVTGGNGGEGGAILLCAAERINVPGKITAGLGGKGGSATSDTPSKATAVATGGDGGTGGTLKFGDASMNPTTPIPVNITGGAAAGNGGPGGTPVVATGDSYSLTAHSGENAQATGGNGGFGGDVMCGNVTFTGWRAVAGTGGPGGIATATGGKGSNAWYYGPYNGGSAVAQGGNGGAPGGSPTCMAGAVTAGSAGPGGNATATSGSGGSNTFAGTPGSSGSATATGGANGDKLPGTTSSSPATPPARASAEPARLHRNGRALNDAPMGGAGPRHPPTSSTSSRHTPGARRAAAWPRTARGRRHG